MSRGQVAMKKSVTFIIIILGYSIFTHNLVAQTFTNTRQLKIQPKAEAGQQNDLDSDKMSVTVSADYNLSYLNFSNRSEKAKSILTWRDMYLNGGKITGEAGVGADIINRIYLSVEYAGSFNGYWTDDDTNNAHGYIGVTESSATVLGFDFALGNESGFLTKKIGLNLTSLNFQNYNSRHFAQDKGPFYPDISGKVCTYDQTMLGLYTNVKARLLDTSFFYADLDGLAGLALGIGEGNWLRRGDLQHPGSFRTTGLFFRAGGSAEIGFKIKMFTIYLGIDAVYEVSPWLSHFEMFYADGHTYEQGLFQELSRAVFNAGIKASF